MSIATSREERLAALAKLAEAPAEQVERDLTFWTLAKIDHQEAFRAANEVRNSAQELHAEADAWLELIGAELHRRRREEQS